ncbi:MAG: hypothetical protein U5R49_00090 [Deltaproteobacteria bacterium]|nr:hypothetical protein [Deltaproteobacteria bacterium]
MSASLWMVGTILFLLAGFAPNGRAAPSATDPGQVPPLFAPSTRCVACHNGLTAPSGRDVSIGYSWEASMMANSSRDPYWQAAVRRETLDHPEARAHIQDECAACHMPMARYQAHVEGREGPVFSLAPALAKQTPMAVWAADGVSCTLCHQIQAENLGTPESFTAGFMINTEKAPGTRSAFGPFEVDAGRTRVMRSAGRFAPTEGLHLQQSALCASCHTLYTQTLGPDGDVIGRLPEQVPYLEWRHSDYAREDAQAQSCQSCHMPLINDPMPITSVLGISRDAFSRHAFRGGNFFMLNMLRLYATPLAVQALPQNLSRAVRETEANLTTDAATLTIDPRRRSGEQLSIDVRVGNLTGHKLPTAYPSRRVWIQLTVHDGRDRRIFESGALNPDGSIAGNDNDRDPSLYEPHYARIDQEAKVQIYEAIMVTPWDRVTTGLLSAIRFIKDNRMLPSGFHKDSVDADVAVRGRAGKDDDFQGGGDRVQYTIPARDADGPFHITARLWYQPIAYRWAHNLGRHPSPETDRFVTYYTAMANDSARLLTQDSVSIE